MALAPDCLPGIWQMAYGNCDRGLSDADKSKWLEHSTYQAMKTADEFTWLYNEAHELVEPNLTSNQSQTPGYELEPPIPLDAVRDGRAEAQQDQALGFDIDFQYVVRG